MTTTTMTTITTLMTMTTTATTTPIMTTTPTTTTENSWEGPGKIGLKSSFGQSCKGSLCRSAQRKPFKPTHINLGQTWQDIPEDMSVVKITFQNS